MPLKPGRRILLQGGDPQHARDLDKKFLRSQDKREDPLAEKVSAQLRNERTQRERELRFSRLDMQVAEDKKNIFNDITEREASKPSNIMRARRAPLASWRHWCEKTQTIPNTLPSLDIPIEATIWLAAHEAAPDNPHRVDALRLGDPSKNSLRILTVEHYFRDPARRWDTEDVRICHEIVGQGGIDLANDLARRTVLLPSDRVLQLLELKTPIGARPEAGVLLLENYRQRSEFNDIIDEITKENLQHFTQGGFSWLAIHPRNQSAITRRVCDISAGNREYLGLSSRLYDDFGLESLTDTTID